MNRGTKRPGYVKTRMALGLMAVAGMLLQTSWGSTALASGLGGYSRADYMLPPDIEKQGVTFAGTRIPLERRDVQQRVHEQLNFLLMDRRSRLVEWFDRLTEYGPVIKRVLQEENVPPDLIYVAVLVGDLLPNGKSRTGGVGWWALPAPKGKKNHSAAGGAMTDDWDDRRDPILSTKIACSILKGIRPKKDDADWLITISAFVDSTEKVDAVIARSPGFSFWDMVMPTFSEVLIPRLVALKLIDTYREFYHLNIPTGPTVEYDFLGRLKLTKDLPLHVVAKWCGVTPRAMWELNPGVNPSTGILPKADAKNPSGLPLRVPKGSERSVRELLVKEGYLAG
jgi:membrane-bound lytic murein transglycosylase D